MASSTTSSILFIPKLQPFVKKYNQSSPDSLSLKSSFAKLSLSSKVVCRSTYNVQVIVADNEPEERLVNRFRREVLRAGVIQESKRRRFFENSQEKRKRKTREAAKRNRKRRPQAARSAVMNGEEEKNKKKKKEVYDEAEDNWELPGDIPIIDAGNREALGRNLGINVL